MADIRLLGRILGDVIREQEGSAAFDLIERIRKLSVGWRLKRDAVAGRELNRLLKNLSVGQAVSVVRAFSYFSHLANLAEDRHHVRRREHHERLGHVAEGSLAASFDKLARRGLRASEIAQTLQRAHVSPVLTAHPTEVQRQSVLDAERRIAQLLSARDRAEAEREHGGIEAQLRARVTQLWQTRLLRPTKLSVANEIENALSYYPTTFLREIPKLYAELEERLHGHTVAPFLRMGHWIGGDRDGNPNVSAATLELALAKQCETALRFYLTEVHELGAELSMSTLLVEVSPALQALAKRSHDDNPQRGDEPYRRALIGVYARLAATLEHLTGTEALRHAVAPSQAYADAAEFQADLETVRDSLAGHHGQALAQARLLPLIRAVQVFGFHLATVDLRQSSDQHELVVAELLKVARIEPDYSALDEAAKVELLGRVLHDARVLRVPTHAYGEHTRAELAILEAARRARERFGGAAIRHAIISHTETVSDLLELLVLQKEAGLLGGAIDDPAATQALVVVPLFETIADLRHATEIMRGYYAVPGVLALLLRSRCRAGHHARLLRQQQGRRLLHQQLGALPRRDRAGRTLRAVAARARAGDAPVPRSRRHGRPRRRPQLRGDPGPATWHRERPDPPHRAGRGDRLQVRQPRDRPPQPRDPGRRHARGHAAAADARCPGPSSRWQPSSRSARWTPTARWSTRPPASPTTSSAPRRSARSPSSTSARARPRASRPARSKTCARFPGASAGASAARRCRASSASAPRWRAGSTTPPARPRRRRACCCCNACTANGRFYARCCRTWTWCSPRAT